MRSAFFITFVLLIVRASAAGPANAPEDLWKAGVAKVDITPELPIWLSGYASRNKPANSIHDHLWAKALVIEDHNGNRGAVVTMDLVGIPREISQTVCKQLAA